MDLDQIIASAGHKIVNRDEQKKESKEEVPAAAAEEAKPAAEVEVKKEETVAAPAPPDRFKILSESLGQEFATDEDLNTWKSSLTEKDTKLKEFETRIEQIQREKEELAQSFDPKSLFASDELFVLNGLLKKFPDKSPVILTEISTRDFDKSYLESPVEVLALNLMLENPGIYSSKADAEEDVLAKYEVDDPAEIDPKAKRKMQVAAREAVEKFNGLKAQIEIPKPVDRTAEKEAKDKTLQEKRKTMEEATAPLFTKAIPDALKDLEFPVIIKGEDGKEVTEVAFKYEIGESYAKSKVVQEILASVRESTIREGTEWNSAKEAKLKSEVTDLLKANYLYHNREKVYAALREDLFTKFSDEAWMKRHNVRPLREDGTTAKPDEKAEALAKKQADFLKQRGIKT